MFRKDDYAVKYAVGTAVDGDGQVGRSFGMSETYLLWSGRTSRTEYEDGVVNGAARRAESRRQ